jgi:glycerol uptake facilitator-like aquaporin
MQREEGGSAMSTAKSASIILSFEFFGSLFLVIFQSILSGVELIFAVWVLIAIGARISGSHYNPAVTLAFMF